MIIENERDLRIYEVEFFPSFRAIVDDCAFLHLQVGNTALLLAVILFGFAVGC